ncbi:MAX gene-associated protein [Trichomycterus rosablanca]|uniref:MAX gene-associated protein n=1 Tax=Trichomycterus rosablanca TaxID=2290929 RepID=UPI002F35DFE5
MEGSNTEVILEKASKTATHLLLTGCMKQVQNDVYSNNQAVTTAKETSHQLAINPVSPTKGSTQPSYMSTNIQVTLENESVWSRFHSLGTEMILTKQGRRMFPCCRFRLSGLEPARKYSLIMDIMPVNDFTYKWNGKTWEPVAVGESHVPGNVCVHPESPAHGQQWMESPVSFYKVKLTNECIDQEDCLHLRPMHRYQPRLYVVPVDSEEPAALDSPNVKMFTFPVTEFYAVTSYQNPQITQLKIDCNPFAMAFREDSKSIRLVQNKFRLHSTAGTNLKSPVLSLARSLSMKRKDCALKNAATSCNEDNSKKDPVSLPSKEREAQTSHTALSYSNDITVCKETFNCSKNEIVVRENQTNPPLVELVTSSDIKPSENKSLQEPLQSTEEAVLPQSNPEASKHISDAANSQISLTDSKSPNDSLPADISQTQENSKLDSVELLLQAQLSDEHNTTDLFPQKLTEVTKAKSKWWSKYARPLPVTTTPDISLQPDLDDVDGMLFVSFGAKNTLSNDVENVEQEVTSSPPLPTLDRLDNQESEDASLSRISKLESILLHDLQQMKHRQVIHPLLQDVGMKLSLLNPTLAIDLQYLGVQLPFPSPVHNDLSSPDAACSFVSRTGKTNDPTKIKGWREKFSPTQSTPEGLRNSSAFCSDMLDEYLEKEAQQISNRVAVFSTGSTLPVSYQLPSKSSSYIVTLNSRLKTQSALTKVYSNPSSKILSKSSPTGSPRMLSPEPQHGLQGNKAKGIYTFQAQTHAIRSTGSSCKPGVNKHLGKLQESYKSSAGFLSCNSSVRYPMTSAKIYSQILIKDMEEEALHHGKGCTHITTKRAKFALHALLNFQKVKKRSKFRIQHQDGCSEEFCRLGCICDSLRRENRGPTHCRRVDCMLECKCFKHKVLLMPPPNVTTVQQGKKRAFLAFSIGDTESENRPPPASSITTLWKRTTEDSDSDPVFIPRPANLPKKEPRLHSSVSQSIHQIAEEDKDPVYLYFESMMTCARVRKFNSNPPPQIHMVPMRKATKGAKQLSSLSEEGESLTSEKISEDTPTESTENTGEPEPTKLLEILSECNWEPHRNLVLSALFRQMNSNHLSEPFFIGKYKVQLVSTTYKQGDRSTTVTYKVCVSHAEEHEVNEDQHLRAKRKRTKSKTCTEEDFTDSADVDSQRRSSGFISKQPRKLFSLISHFSLAGYLKADKKKPGRPALGLIKVNGKMYNQAKLLLGQMGALHPVNRYAAFVTGRLQHTAQDQPKSVGDVAKSSPPNVPLGDSANIKVASILNPSTSGLAIARPAVSSVTQPTTVPKRGGKSNFASLSVRAILAGQRRSQQDDASSVPVDSTLAPKPLVPDGSKFVLLSGLQTIKPTADPSGEAAQGAILPPGQQVVLQPVPGKTESNFFCQYNGQVIKLVPISPEPLTKSHTSPGTEGSLSQDTQTPTATDPSKDTASIQKPLSSTTVTNPSSKLFPVITPRILSLSGTSGMNIANGIPAIKLQSSFPGKTGTFSFRICPPKSEGKSVGSGQDAKPSNLVAGAPSTLILPGGFTLIKLEPPPSNSANVNTASNAAEISQSDETMKKSIIQDRSSSPKEKCQNSKSSANLLPLETSNGNVEQINAVDLSHGNNSLSSEDANECESVEEMKELVNTLPVEAQMLLRSNNGEFEHEDMDNLPLYGSEQTEKVVSVHKEKICLNTEITNNIDAFAGSPTEVGANSSNNTTTKGIGDDPGSQDETSKSPVVNESSLTPEQEECQKSSQASVIKQNQEGVCNIPDNMAMVANKPLINTANMDLVNISKENTSFDVFELQVKEVYTETSQTFPHPKVGEGVQGNGPQIVIKIEPYNESETDMTANQNDTSNQSLATENSSPAASKIKTIESRAQYQNLVNHIDFEKQRLGPESIPIKTASCSDPPEAVSTHPPVNQNGIDQVHHLPLVNNQEPNNNQTPKVSSKQGLPNKKQLSCTIFNNTASKHAKDNDQDINIGVPWSVLSGQRPAVASRLTVHQPNTDLKATESKLLVHEDENLSEEDSGDYCTEDSSDDATSDIEDSLDSGDTSSDEDGTVDIESIEDNQEQMFISKMKAKARQKMKSKRASEFRGWNHIEHSSIGDAPDLKDARRQTHTENERLRRIEIQQQFVTLKKALNIAEKIKSSKYDLLNQARLMIWALEGRSQYLEEKKKALLKRRFTYLTKIAELSANTKDTEKTHFKENCEQIKQSGVQNQVKNVKPQINPRRVDSEGDKLPPQLGQRKAPNYIPNRSKNSSVPITVAPYKSSELPGNHSVSGSLPSVKDGAVAEDVVRILITQNPLGLPSVSKPKSLSAKPKPPVAPYKSSELPGNHSVSGSLPSVKDGAVAEDVVRILITQNPLGLPSVSKPKSLSAKPKPPAKVSALPKIVLQSFRKPDTVKPIKDAMTVQPTSTQWSFSAQPSLDQEEKKETSNTTETSNGLERTSVPEHLSQESPGSSSVASESDLYNDAQSELDRGKPASASNNVRKRRSKEAVHKEASSKPDGSGSRQLRHRSPVVTRMATRSTPTLKRKRIF